MHRRTEQLSHDTVEALLHRKVAQCTEVRFASFNSGGFTIMAVINPPERKLAKHTSVQYCVTNVVYIAVIPPLHSNALCNIFVQNFLKIVHR